jgi:hypothetical protein
MMAPAASPDFQDSAAASNTHGSAWLLQVEAEQDAMHLLRRTLDDVLEQNHCNEHLGASLDDEWSYIEQYRQDF